MAKGRVRDIDMGYERIMRQIEKLSGQRIDVVVGVHADAGSDLVVIAASNEFGTDRIPERSFLRSTVDDGRKEILDDLQRGVDKALDGANLDQQLGLVGEKWVGRVQTTIKTLDTPANAPSTVRQKGFDNPLIETGRLRQSIAWKLRKNAPSTTEG